MKTAKRTIFNRFAMCTAALLAMPVLMGADGKGCSAGGDVPVGNDVCGPRDCDGLGSPGDAKLCPGGSSVGRSVCGTSKDGACFWDFPSCPDPMTPVDAGPRACGPRDCDGLGSPGDAKICPGGISLARSVCATRSDGACFWDFAACPDPVTPDAGAPCTDADCFGQPVLTDLKLCPNGPNVGRSVCTRFSAGVCGWDFPPCATTGPGTGECAASDCAAQSRLDDAKLCADGTAVGRSLCTKVRVSNDPPAFACGWDFPACAGPAGDGGP
jgi:hypothetical protein